MFTSKKVYPVLALLTISPVMLMGCIIGNKADVAVASDPVAAAEDPTLAPAANVLTSDDFSGGTNGSAINTGDMTDAASGGEAMAYGFAANFVRTDGQLVAPGGTDGDHAAFAMLDTGHASCTISMDVKSANAAGTGLIIRNGDLGSDGYFFLLNPGDAFSLGCNSGYVLLSGNMSSFDCLGDAGTNPDASAADINLKVVMSANLISIYANDVLIGTKADSGTGTRAGILSMTPNAVVDNLVVKDCE